MKFSISSKRAARGFTLVELVIVIAVIAILAALLVPTILGQAERARLSRAKSDVSNLAKAIGRVRTDTANSSQNCLLEPENLISPTATANCGATLPLCSAPTTMPGYPCWNGPYFTNILNDPWDLRYRYEMDPTSFAVTVMSNGPDRLTPSADDIS